MKAGQHEETETRSSRKLEKRRVQAERKQQEKAEFQALSRHRCRGYIYILLILYIVLLYTETI